MLIEIHMIQNHSPSNLNRDDLGAPKSCIFGGVTRARISSQCLKRSIRNPGRPENPDDPGGKRKGGSLFADAMQAYLGLRTKFFPWLVEKVLEDTEIRKKLKGHGETEAEVLKQQKGIVAACKTIARSEQKAAADKKEKEKKDKRPQTPQLIFLGPAQARSFVEKLLELKASMRRCYDYFLDPATVFESFLEPELANAGLTDEQREKALNAGWRIRNTESRMAALRRLVAPRPDSAESSDETARETIRTEAGATEQPAESTDDSIAREIAEGLTALAQKDEKEFSKITSQKKNKDEPTFEVKRDKKPGDFSTFEDALKEATFNVSVDIALFGRMTTSDYVVNIEAAMQVAHAISTHEVVTEVDYFTAVDDLGKTQASGHLGEGMFNSACFYKYFCLDWDQLVRNLTRPEPDKDNEANANSTSEVKRDAEKLAACTLGHFLVAAARSTPSGKQNSCAANNEPCGILIEVKKTKTPTSFANAFAEPVERIGKADDEAADEKSIEGRSVACLADHVQAIRKAYCIDSKVLWYSPKLWRFPLQYWERENDGKKKKARLVTEQRFDVLGGENGNPNGLVEAVIAALDLPLTWQVVKDAGKAPATEAKR